MSNTKFQSPTIIIVSKHDVKSTETARLIRDWEKGGEGVWRWGEREIIYLSLHCHHQNDSCIQMGSDESHFNVMDKFTRQCPQTTTFLKRKESRSGIEPRSFRLLALPLGQTGSLFYMMVLVFFNHFR